MISFCHFLGSIGWPSPIRWWLLLLMYSLLGVLLLYAAIIVVREKLRERVENGSMGRGVVFALRRTMLMLTGEQVIRRVSRLGLLSLTFGAGYGLRDWQLIRNTHTYFDVAIREKYAEDKYLLQPARMQPWIAKTCKPVDWNPAQQMKFFTYEQMPDCMRVKAFVFYANDKGERVDASLQNGR